MSVASFSVRRPVAVVMRILSLVLLGAICFTRIPVDMLPKITLPTVSVSVSWPNVAPAEIEAQVTRPIEQAVSSVSNLYEVTSTTKEGSANVRIQFTWGTDVALASVEVLQQVERARRKFPDDETLEKPTVTRYDPSQSPVLMLGVSGDSDSVALRTLLDNQISPILESADGVASASVSGGEERYIIVDLDPVKLRAHNISLNQVISRLKTENQNLPAGLVREGGSEYTLRSVGWFEGMDDLLKLPIGSFNGRLVLLEDIAEVTDSHPETRIFTRLNGKPAVAVVITKQSDANTVDTIKNVFEKIEQVNKLFPQIKFQVAYDQSKFIEDSLEGLYHHALVGGGLAVLIILFFLRSIQSTLVVALSIPISIISTFTLLDLCGFTLNTMSLGGLALATGLIVDDAVVVLENIFRHMKRDGLPAREAAVTGTDEIISAVVSSTMTVMVVFLPMVLVEGRSGQMFFQFALVVIFSLSVSLLDATTVVPMLASYMKPEENWKPDSFIAKQFALWDRIIHRMESAYGDLLKSALHHRLTTLFCTAAITFGSLALLPYVGTELMPPTDSGDMTMNLRMPVGTALDITADMAKRAEAIILADPDVDTCLMAIGSNLGMRGAGANSTSFLSGATIKLKPDRQSTTFEVIARLNKKLSALPGAAVRLYPVDMVSRQVTGRTEDFELIICGQDLSVLWTEAGKLIDYLKDIKGLVNLDTNWQEANPEVQFTVDRQRIMKFGLDFQDVADTLSTATKGKTASYYQEGGFQYPISVQFPEKFRKTVPRLLELPIKLPAGGYITLGQVAGGSYDIAPNQITRVNRQRYISVVGTALGRPAGDIQSEAGAMLEGYELPEGYYLDWGSTLKNQKKEYAGLRLAIFLAIALIYMLLASQFESMIHPLTVLVSVPLAASGVIAALFISGRTFGLMAFVGLLMLVGIVVKNGILLVEYTNQLREKGLELYEALWISGTTRMRPILMTAGASILGMLPMAVGLGSGSEIQRPMATAIVGGLATSTLLTLLVVPVVYTYMEGVAAWFRRFLTRK
ncbi:MAG: efflux RND transporter permease subunit [bacterium]|nr:efflux RND transporter permease subunit [bacterium]